MSLNAAQRRQTADEFAANLKASGLSLDDLRERTGLPRSRFDAAYNVDMANPADVWLVRDKLETAVKDAGGQLTPFSVLSDQMRSAANMWFGVRDER